MSADACFVFGVARGSNYNTTFVLARLNQTSVRKKTHVK